MRVDRRELAAVFAGGFVGAVARVGLAEAIPHDTGRWPWATFVVNVVGAFLLAFFTTRLQERLPLSSYRRPLLGTGFGGVRTTFSTLQVELLDRVMSVLAVVAIGIVGGFGAISRFLLDGEVAGRVGRDFPYGTLTVNVLGSFILGVLVGAAVRGDAHDIAGAGRLGSFTTFSTWALESHRLSEGGRLRLGALNLADGHRRASRAGHERRPPPWRLAHDSSSLGYGPPCPASVSCSP